VLWVLLDIAIGLVAVAVLALFSFALYRRVRGLMRTVSAASDEVSRLTAGLTVTPPRR
jgi:hypothetical protein